MEKTISYALPFHEVQLAIQAYMLLHYGVEIDGNRITFDTPVDYTKPVAIVKFSTELHKEELP